MQPTRRFTSTKTALRQLKTLQHLSGELFNHLQPNGLSLAEVQMIFQSPVSKLAVTVNQLIDQKQRSLEFSLVTPKGKCYTSKELKRTLEKAVFGRWEIHRVHLVPSSLPAQDQPPRQIADLGFRVTAKQVRCYECFAEQSAVAFLRVFTFPGHIYVEQWDTPIHCTSGRSELFTSLRAFAKGLVT